MIPDESAVYDVVVAGGGPAGLGAALAATSQGARTLLLEARSFFGGVAALGLWKPVNRLLLDGSDRGGVHDTFVAKLTSLGPPRVSPLRAKMDAASFRQMWSYHQ